MSQTSLFRAGAQGHVDNGASGEVGEGWSTVLGENGREYRWKIEDVPHPKDEHFDKAVGLWRHPSGFVAEFTGDDGRAKTVRYYDRLVELWNKVREDMA